MMCARIAMVTGTGLSSLTPIPVCRGGCGLRGLFLANTINIAADLAGMGDMDLYGPLGARAVPGPFLTLVEYLDDQPGMS